MNEDTSVKTLTLMIVKIHVNVQIFDRSINFFVQVVCLTNFFGRFRRTHKAGELPDPAAEDMVLRRKGTSTL